MPRPRRTHASINAIYMVWIGQTLVKVPDGGWKGDWDSVEDGPARYDGRTHRACDRRLTKDNIPAGLILTTIPTCPGCAVLYDMAMELRAEELGRRATTPKLSA